MKYLPAIAVSGLLLATMSTMASPPPGADLNSPEAHWVQSLQMPGTAISCCSLADCRKVDYRIEKGQLEAFIEERWVAVPKDKVVKRENPTGSAWACYRQYIPVIQPDDIYCFVLLDLT
jgi:hypothetical protein